MNLMLNKNAYLRMLDVISNYSDKKNVMIKSKFLVVFLISLILISCSQEPVNEHQEIYQDFWEDFDKNYVGFNLTDTDWDSVYQHNFSLIYSEIQDTEFFNILKSSIQCLKDGHVSISSDELDKSYSYFYDYLETKPINFISWNAIANNYLTNIQYINNKLAYGKIKGHDIGYFAIFSFIEDSEDYYAIDEFIQKYKDSKGIIFEIRNNGGGDENKAQIIASRLTNSNVVYRYTRIKNGDAHDNLTDYLALTLEPARENFYEGKILLITNRATFSAAEDFTLMLKALPNVIHIGDTTWGGASTGPEFKELSNGWKYSVPKKISYDLDYKPIEYGIFPDFTYIITKSDSLIGKDVLIEKAIEKIIE